MYCSCVLSNYIIGLHFVIQLLYHAVITKWGLQFVNYNYCGEQIS